ncbi:dnaJ homolog subfamily C member 17 [Chrysoperla carnea]|uniref:dnaJ homolog subfamily C member 17 n=1 Tax=Chrysoperla carnea TaxID=189513 RepID=UPI001D094A42|nr:dnaJ homolog subfamily C member 17 [Chrysoperla carnea]
MESKIEDKDLYELFDIQITATESEIKKAYRKKALHCHPDKNPDNPNAAALFHELSLALQILTDAKARQAYDKVLNGKKAAQIRHKELDSRRKKLKEELDARERLAELRGKKEDLRTDAEKLQAEIDRLRKEGAKIVQQENELLKQEMSKKFTSTEPVPWDSAEYRIKIKWKAEKTDDTNGGYTYEELHRFLLKYGDIIGLIVSTKKKGSAMVEYATQEAAEMAVSYEKGLAGNPLTLSWVKGPPPKHRAATTSTLVNDNDFESLVMRNLRQAEERKRLIAEIQAGLIDD